MGMKLKTTLLGGIAIVSVLLYVFFDVGANIGYVLPRRTLKVLAMIITGASIAFSTVVFQTITNNRILTPSIMGLDSLYLLIQTVVIFLFGSQTVMMVDNTMHFLITVGLMVLFSALLFKILFKNEGRNIYFLLLMGIIFGTLFQSLSSFMQVLIDPNEFQIVQDKMFASFNNIHTDLLWISSLVIFIVSIYFVKFMKYLDVLALGREQAINLGVNYDHVVKRLLIVVAILISAATALVGPITFLGLLVVNVTYEFLKTHQHKFLIIAAIFISVIALVGGQFIVERVFTFSTPLSVIINFIGGIYFIYLLLKENRSW